MELKRTRKRNLLDDTGNEMKLFPKILLIIGLALLGLGLLVPDNYERCHGDVII